MYILTDVFAVFEKQISPKLPKEFVIEVDDRGELYLKSLVNILKSNVKINNNAVRETEFGDFIVFTKNDVSLETSYGKVSRLDLPILSLVGDYSKIEKSIKNFFNNVFRGKKEEKNLCCKNCPLYTTCYNKHDNRIYDGQYITMEEKVSIMYNFVKVGYEQYDIVSLFTGQQVVTIEDELFEVKKDRNGKKYLQLL